ncbi:MAG: DUF2934 domain-containing protein [Roseococcus sp.]
MSIDESLTRDRTEQLAYRLWQEAGCPEGEADRLWRKAEALIATAEAERDVALEESFPASDPPAASGMTGPVRPEPPLVAQPARARPVLAAPARPPAPAAKGWRAAFATWWAYPSKPG